MKEPSRWQMVWMYAGSRLFWFLFGLQVAWAWHAKIDMEHANASAHQLDAVTGVQG